MKFNIYDMRYIKMFETFNSEKYYREITTYDDSVAEPIDMSERTLGKIKKLFEGFSDENGEPMTDPDVEIEYGKYPGPDETEVFAVELNHFSDGEQIETLLINELDDEWFTVEMFCYLPDKVGGFWICDQFDGFVMLLKDKGILR